MLECCSQQHVRKPSGMRAKWHRIVAFGNLLQLIVLSLALGSLTFHDSALVSAAPSYGSWECTSQGVIISRGDFANASFAPFVSPRTSSECPGKNVYFHNTKCDFEFFAPEDHHIYVEFVSFDLDANCNYDYVYLKSRSRSRQMCSSDTNAGRLLLYDIAQESRMRVEFVTNDHYRCGGFSAFFSAYKPPPSTTYYGRKKRDVPATQSTSPAVKPREEVRSKMAEHPTLLGWNAQTTAGTSQSPEAEEAVVEKRQKRDGQVRRTYRRTASSRRRLSRRRSSSASRYRARSTRTRTRRSRTAARRRTQPPSPTPMPAKTQQPCQDEHPQQQESQPLYHPPQDDKPQEKQQAKQQAKHQEKQQEKQQKKQQNSQEKQNKQPEQPEHQQLPFAVVAQSESVFESLYKESHTVADYETEYIHLVLKINGKPVKIDGTMSGSSLRSRIEAEWLRFKDTGKLEQLRSKVSHLAGIAKTDYCKMCGEECFDRCQCIRADLLMRLKHYVGEQSHHSRRRRRDPSDCTCR